MSLSSKGNGEAILSLPDPSIRFVRFHALVQELQNNDLMNAVRTVQSFFAKDGGKRKFESCFTHFAWKCDYIDPDTGNECYYIIEMLTNGINFYPREVDHDEYIVETHVVERSCEDVVNFIRNRQSQAYVFAINNCKHLAHSFYNAVLSPSDPNKFGKFCGRLERKYRWARQM